MTDFFEMPLVWVDVETTGLDPEENDIIEITIARDGMSYPEDSCKVKMERPSNAQPRALEINGYTAEAWEDAADPGTVWQEIADSGILSNCIVAGHNVKFDMAFLEATFRRHDVQVGGKVYQVSYHSYDTVTLALEHLRPWITSVSLTPICVALGIPVRDTHTSSGDVKLAMAVDRVLRRATEIDRQAWRYTAPTRLAAWEAAGKPKDWSDGSLPRYLG